MSSFAAVVWTLITTFLLVGYIIVMFQIVVDLFRRSDVGGWSKALWILGLLFVPIITALIYVIAYGGGMTERQRESVEKAATDTVAYVRRVAGTSSSEEIAKAKALLDAGTISEGEYGVLKDRALHAPA